MGSVAALLALGLALVAAPSPPVVEAPAVTVPAPAPAPASLTATLGPLAPGTYTVHLHTICNGGPAFHITTIGFVRVGPDGGAAVTLPAGDFGKGWCLVVYTDPSATRVVTYRPV
ncbi:MAG TPA: hypothetical protein VF160_02350 [Candidatus Dormibacteraeota bacterium]